jgi:hypothetical protein
LRVSFKKPVQLYHYSIRYGDNRYGYADPIIWTVKVKDSLSNETYEEEHISQFNNSNSNMPERFANEKFTFKFKEFIVAKELTFIFKEIRYKDSYYNNDI